MTLLFKSFVLVLLVLFLVPPAHGRFLDHYIGKLSHLHSVSRVSSMPPSPAPRASPATAAAPSPGVDRHKPPPPPQRTQIFNVMSFGAVGDGASDDTQAMKMAWDSACDSESESATLLVPKGHSFMVQSTIFTGPCKANMVFQIDGTMMPPDGPESWPKGVSKRQWLVFYRINGMAMQGGGLIDGRGEKWWNLPCKPHKGKNGTTLPGPCDSPVALRFFMSSNLTVRGLKIKNSPQFHFRFDGCQNVHIESLVIKAPSLSPNTDGIHIENTSNVTLHNSLIANGDDCVSIGAGTHNVNIKNITCGPSHGISIGSLGMRNSRACVSNITVTDSIIKHSDNGVRIKTWQGGSGSVSKIVFQNIHMDAVRNPIMIDQFYCATKNCPNQTNAVWVSDVMYSNIRGTYDARSPPMHFGCSDSVPCSNLTLAEVELLPAQGEVLLDPFCWNAYGSMMTLSIPPAFCLLEGSPESVPDTDVGQC